MEIVYETDTNKVDDKKLEKDDEGNTIDPTLPTHLRVHMTRYRQRRTQILPVGLETRIKQLVNFHHIDQNVKDFIESGIKSNKTNHFIPRYYNFLFLLRFIIFDACLCG